jgi:hypothetical protein
MKTLLLCSAIGLSFSFAVGAAEAPKRFKNFQEIRARAEYWITCSSAAGGEQVHATFHYGYAPVGGGPIVGPAGFVALLPNEALLAREYRVTEDTFTKQDVSDTEIKIYGGSGIRHNDSLTVSFTDSTSGKFKGKLTFREANGPLQFEKKVVCIATNYSLPKP